MLTAQADVTSHVVEGLFLPAWHLYTLAPLSFFSLRSLFTRFCLVSPHPCESRSHELELGSSLRSSLSRAVAGRWIADNVSGLVLHDGLVAAVASTISLASVAPRIMPSLHWDSCTTGSCVRVSSSASKRVLWPVFLGLSLWMGTAGVLLASGVSKVSQALQGFLELHRTWSGRDVEALVAHATSMVLVRRDLLACFFSADVFIREFLQRGTAFVCPQGVAVARGSAPHGHRRYWAQLEHISRGT